MTEIGTGFPGRPREMPWLVKYLLHKLGTWVHLPETQQKASMAACVWGPAGREAGRWAGLRGGDRGI